METMDVPSKVNFELQALTTAMVRAKVTFALTILHRFRSSPFFRFFLVDQNIFKNKFV